MRAAIESALARLRTLDSNEHAEGCDENRDMCCACGWEFEDHPVHMEHGRVCKEFQMRACTCGLKAAIAELEKVVK
jgi:hypothetical protein